LLQLANGKQTDPDRQGKEFPDIRRAPIGLSHWHRWPAAGVSTTSRAIIFPWPLRGHSSRNKINASFGPSLRYGRKRCAGPGRRPSSCHRGRLAARETGDFSMATIGVFTKKDGKFNGKIQTLALSLNVGILPNTNGGSDAPAYRVFAGKFELGAGWEKTSDSGRDYLSIKLDDPSFQAPVYANLIEMEDGTFSLLWSRSQPR
jgi:uncharacterized protein (DUF736 family)